MSKIKKVLAISLGMRALTFLLCIVLFGVSYLTGGRLWFQSNMSLSEVDYALKSGANPDAYDEDGLTPLMRAVILGNIGAAQLMITAGANVNAVSGGRSGKETALHYAARNSDKPVHRNILILLVQNGAYMNVKNQMGDAPIHLANLVDSIPARMQALLLLVSHGSDINMWGARGIPLLHLFLEGNELFGLGELLKRYGSILNYNQKNSYGLDAVAYAYKLGFTDGAKAIKERKPVVIDANKRDPNGWTKIMLAVMNNNKNELVEFAQEVGANINARSGTVYGETAFTAAVLHNRPEMITALFQLGANPLVGNNEESTPLHEIMHQPEYTVRVHLADMLLEKKPALINQRNKRGDTLLHRLVRTNDAQMLAYLIKKYRNRIDLSVRNNDRLTALELANALGRKNLAQIITSN